ncbi:MAG: BlaI/MecI/CopY family transcriptional regulator [Actinobacteria bacterium]|nr:BlaI/MecI/CopY family transcriptional regulator [Actinomycetota bacterium]
MTCMTRLGGLERAAMEVLWAADAPLTARQVAEALADRGLAYTTWLTVLSRCERKGLLSKERAGRAHAYSPSASREDHIAVLMQQALGQADDREAALQHFVRSVSPAEAAALRRALDGR